MNLDDRLSQLVRDALAPMLAERFEHLEERLAERLAGVVQSQPAPSSPPPLLTQKEVACHLKVAPRTVQRMVSAGKFPPSIPISPGCPRWRKSDVDTWIAQRGGESG